MAADRGVTGATLIRGCVEADRWTANRLFEPTGDGQHRIAPGFDIKPASVHPPQQGVAGVFVEGSCVKAATLLIGCREHDRPVQRLDRPSRRNELMSQPIEQFRVAWSIAQSAKIAGSRNQSAAEMVLPDSIDHCACGQRIIWASNCLGELEAATAVLKGGPIAPQNSQKAPRAPWHRVYPHCRGSTPAFPSDWMLRRAYGSRDIWEATFSSGDRARP